MNTDAFSITFQESWAKDRSPIVPILTLNDVHGSCPANGGFQILFVCHDDESKHIALPEPPCLLPATDYDAITLNLNKEVSLAKTIRVMEQVKLNIEEEILPRFPAVSHRPMSQGIQFLMIGPFHIMFPWSP